MEKLKEPVHVTQAFLPPFEEYAATLASIWDTHWMTNNGALHEELGRKLEEYLKSKHVTLFVNGHLALDVAVKALGLKGEVITTPFTFASTTHALVMNGLTPVFCDINLTDFTIDAGKIEALITEKTSAILAVHVYGYPCAVEKIEKIAAKHHLKVIYDAAHAFGVEIDGTGIGSYGDVAMFSFHATKVFNTIEGGALTFKRNEYKRLFDLYKNFGITGPETVEAVGLNAKMNEFQAAMGLCNLQHVSAQIQKRKQITEIYRDGLKDIDGIYFPVDQPGIKSNYAYFPILIDEKKFGLMRNDLYDRLQDYNVFARKYFYPLTSDYDCFAGKYAGCELPNARYAAERILTLPMYGELGETAEKIVHIIRGIAGK